ncbi:hypothetical protein SASPL_156245 [Salvia splendens]|uniref:RING-type domain-containing protein n=1 Tax=Salvia splendens TaxID=180675 RepID=A0A8X8VX00_SALSN|nr:hypothetical protein SASPL_156245 [Salvia splendens]
MLSASTFQQLYAAQHTQQYMQLPSFYQPPPDTGCLPYGLPQPNRQDPILVWFLPQQPRENSFDGKFDSNISDDNNKQSKKAKEFFSTMDVLKILHQLEEMTGAMAFRMPCTHMFHAEYVVKWLWMSHTCPICGYEMPTRNRY